MLRLEDLELLLGHLLKVAVLDRALDLLLRKLPAAQRVYEYR